MLNTRFAIYAALLTIAAVVSAGTAILAWKRRAMTGARPFLILMLGLCIWSATYAVYWTSVSAGARLFWLNATQLGAVLCPGAFFALAVSHTGRQHWLAGRRAWLLVILPVVTLVLLVTDSWHHLFYAGKQTPESSVIFDGGPAFWLHVFYSYILLMIGLLLLAQAFLRSRTVFRRQAALVLFAGLLPWVTNVISLAGLNPLIGLDVTPISFTASGLLLAVGLWRTALLDLVPQARNQVIDHMAEGVVVLDALDRIVDVNGAARRLIARVGKPVSESWVGTEMTSVFADWPDWLTQAPSEEFVAEGMAADGKAYAMRVSRSALLSARGRRQGWVVVLSDMTRARQLEQDLRRNLTYFRAIFDTSSDSILIFDAQTRRLLDVNARTVAMFGYSRDEILAQPEVDRFSSGIEPYTPEAVLAYFRQARLEERTSFEWQGRTKAGELIWLDVHIRYALLGDEERFVLTMSDATERKHAAQQRFAIALERERANLLAHFIRDASHEFRTPLATIQTGLYLLGRTDEPEQRAARTEQVSAEVQRITRLVDMLAMLSKLDRGVSPVRHPVDLNALVGETVEACQHSHADLLWRAELWPAALCSAVDEEQIEEALRQLLDNAARFTPVGAQVDIRTGTRDGGVFVDIRDSGPGMADDVLARIFDRFYREDSAHTSPGFGLGLSIAKRITELHDGALTVTSAVGQGSTFSVWLPFAPEAPGDSAANG